MTFLRSYPNRIPLSGRVVRRIAATLDGLHLDRLYDNFGRCVPVGAKAVMRGSAERYAGWTDGEHDHLTW